MNKPKENERQYQQKNKCACGKDKKVMSKYCIPCSNEINKLRWYLWFQSKRSETKRSEYESKLKELLIFHWQWVEPVKTKTTKMREKRAWLSKVKD